MNVERLERMRDLLRRDAANPHGVKFDLGTWASPAYDDNEVDGPSTFDLPADVEHNEYNAGYSTAEPIKVEVSCGTTACAFGLAAISGEFAKEGLTYEFMLSAYRPRNSGPVRGHLMPAYGGCHGMHAAQGLFDISLEDASYFFDPECYDGTPKEAEGELLVAQRIDDFIKGDIDTDYHPAFKDNDEPEDDSED
jgi:hypothetical protein